MRRRRTVKSVGAHTSDNAWHKYTIKGVKIPLAENPRFPG